MKTIKRIKKRKSLIRFIAMFVAAVLVFELMPYLSDHAELTAEAATLNVPSEWQKKMNSLGWINIDPNGNYISSNSEMWQNTETIQAYEGGTVDENKYTGTPSTQGLSYEIKYDSVLDGYYRNYKVYTGNQLAYVMGKYTSSSNDIKASSQDIENAGVTGTSCNKLGIELLCDIDLGAAQGKAWINSKNTNFLLEFEGNGYHLYNMFLSSSYFLSSDQQFIIKNLTFSNVIIKHSGGMFGSGTKCLFYNVNWEKCVTPVGQGSSTIVFGYNYNYCYLKDCSIKDCYVRGHAHSSFYGSYNGLKTYSSNDTYIGDTSATDNNNVYYIEIPKKNDIPDYDEIEKCFQGKLINWTDKNGTFHSNKLQEKYPSIFESCLVTDSYIYLLGGNHSGGFVSCLQDYAIFDSCYSNACVYGAEQLGVFVGAVIGSGDGFNTENPATGKKIKANSVFKNCFTSGSIEGQTNIGGFVGMIFNDNRSLGSVNRGQAIFYNCYSTSSVGMEYSGNYVGGFVGYVRSNYQASIEENPHLFCNCFAAGEVGGIVTETNNTSTNTIGGFMGFYEKNGALSTCINCYYDMQTTGMRERAIGYNGGQLSGTIAGLAGVYTTQSSRKNITGLTDSAELGDGYTRLSTQLYPVLNTFKDKPAKPSNYDTDKIVAMKYNRKLQQYFDSITSVSTVLLNHYDTILEDNGEERDATSSDEDKKAYDTVRDITSKFELTTNDDLGITWGKDTEKNTSRGLKDKFGGDDGFTLEYTTVKQDENGAYLTGTENESKITKTFTPDVLTIGRYDDPADERGYYYKCFDFAPGIQWLKVSAGDIENNVTNWDNKADLTYTDPNLVGSRSFRLLPTAYLNAGDMMHINVETDNTNDSVTYSNIVTIAEGGEENKINGLFNHSVGVAFAITDKYRMGSDIYASQSIDRYNGTALTENDKFAFYSGYAVNDTNGNTIDDLQKSKNIGSDAMVSQKFEITNNNGSYAGITNSSSSGKVRVRIFRANAKETGTGTDFYLEKGDEIDYNDTATLAKWQGEKPFDTNDSNSYYYLDYYWRLNDGRYLFDRKLVRITANTYSVTMKTGLLDEKFSVKDGTPKTAIDQYVTDNITTNPDQTKVWDKDNLYPSLKDGFNTENASNYYEDYNISEFINGNDYYTKILKIDTASSQTAVGWMRTSDYKLTALIVEAVDSTGTHHEMSRIDANNANDPLNFDKAEYTYDYKTYSVTQDSETKIFSVIENTTVTNTFSVESYTGAMINGVSKYILFSFSTTGNVSQGFSEIKDSLIITALFRKNDANVKTEKQVLANTGNPVQEVLKTEKISTFTNKDDQTVIQKYYSSIDTIDENKRVDDTGIEGNSKRQAVLSDDTLTYRLKAYNAGYFTSREVNIYDVIPEGTTYIENSAKLYRQKSLSTSNHNRYAALEDITSDNNIVYDNTSQKLSAEISGIALEENYYLEYKVKVNDINAADLFKTIENKANYQFIHFNGDTTNDFNEANQNAALDNSIVSMNVAHNNQNEYVADFQRSDIDSSKTYTIDSYTNVFPDNFQFTENSVKVYDTSSGDDQEITSQVEITYTTENGKKTGFTIKNNHLDPAIVLNENNRYKVVFKGTSESLTDSSQEIRNKATVTYTEIGDGEVPQTKATAISIVERLTNQTETDVTHLYVDIDKIIPESDPAQTFLFKIERFADENLSGTPDEISYTKINCITKQTDDKYTGSRLLQLDKRGYYRITEVNDWSSSDYLFGNITYTDISKVSGFSDTKTISTQNQSAVIQLPRQYNTVSLAFPTSFGELETGSYPILKFTNKLNDYAYKTSQAYAENNIS